MRWLYRWLSVSLTATVSILAAVATFEPQVAANREQVPPIGVHQSARQPGRAWAEARTAVVAGLAHPPRTAESGSIQPTALDQQPTECLVDRSRIGR